MSCAREDLKAPRRGSERCLSRGRAQEDLGERLGCDLNGRRIDETGRPGYTPLQSRRVKSLSAAEIKKAVDDLLKGEWAKKTAAFHFATSFTEAMPGAGAKAA